MALEKQGPDRIDATSPAVIEVFTTCPQSKSFLAENYLDRVAECCAWSESFGAAGMLIYTDNSLVDPWLLAQTVIRNSRRLSPLVAVQPAYMHPYSAAKMVASLGHMHGRRVCLNFLAGGFRGDLTALGDDTAHDERYARTTEYALILRGLLEGAAPVTFEGRHYTVRNLTLAPALPRELFPGLMISGSSPAGLAAAERVGATAVRYPRPTAEEDATAAPPGLGLGVRLGIIARAEEAEAWDVAQERFPADRRGQLTHQLAMKVSDSHWHKQLSKIADRVEDGPFWFEPFRNYQTFCPYLVGDYDRTAAEIAKYLAMGNRTFILDIPTSAEDLEHSKIVFQRAAAWAAQ